MPKSYEYSVGPGWMVLVEPLIQLCEDNGGTVHQVKEKYGSLRFYYTEADHDETDDLQRNFWNAFADVVLAVESFSLYLCEFTGAPGTLYVTNGGWLKTVSPLYAEKHDMRRLPGDAP